MDSGSRWYPSDLHLVTSGRCPTDHRHRGGSLNVETRSIQAIVRGEYRTKSRDEIRGSGYVVESLQAALWCFHISDSFEQAVLLAANLGEDTYTTSAVCGQIAGTHFGVEAIPPHWLKRLSMRLVITELSDRLYNAPRS